VNFDEALAWLDATRPFGVKLGLENIRRLLAGLGNPQEGRAILHAAGTNGKGSVCAMLDAILRAAGHRTGLYTSPHLVDFCERIRVDGKKIPADDVAAGLSEIRTVSADWDHAPTYFEITTALALWHFARRDCGVIVLETGMGGRLDATNAIHPLVAILTPVAADHTEWLGETLAEVAAEKAGILKAGAPVVSARQEPEVAAVILARAKELGCSLQVVDSSVCSVEVALRGAHQRSNAALAIRALEVAGLAPDAAVIAQGLREVQWPGRFQALPGGIVLDGAHNPHAIAQLVRNWREAYGERRTVVIFGALADKDYAGMMRELAPLAAEFFFVPIREERGLDPETLGACCPGLYRTFDSVESALAATDGPCLVTGSLYLVGAAMSALGIEA
jgi:dihydrofolate synthase / folylpolyglutamate synthase